jgi:hypothetical protein
MTNIAIGTETSADLYWFGDSHIGKPGTFLPTTKVVRTIDAASIVQPGRVRLRTRLTWLGQNGSSFVKTEECGEDWFYKYRGTVGFVPYGDWDKRTPVLHSVVAGLDTTDAGFDDAFVRAASALDGLYNVERWDLRGEHRDVISSVVKDTFSPARILMRGAALWAALKFSGLTGKPEVRVDNLKDTLSPVRIMTGRDYKDFFMQVGNGDIDALYMRLNSARDAKNLRVGQALIADEFPINGLAGFGVAKLWPPIKKTRVFYNGKPELEDTPNAISAADVWYTMNRFCQLHDCFDIWQQVLEGVQFFLARPAKAGVLGGSVNAVLALPPSRMQVGLIGPLLAGLTTEGMKTTPLAEPNFIEYIYGGVHRTVYAQAALFESIRELQNLHPVSLQLNRASWEHVEQLALPATAAEHWLDKVKPVCARMAWDCVNRVIACICIPYNREMLKYVMQPANVPDWSQGINHLTEEGLGVLESQLKPARPTVLPESNIAYRYDEIGLVSPMQVSSAVERLGARVEYVVTTDGARQHLIEMPARKPGRFPWLITPTFQASGVVAVATLIFPHDIARRYQESADLRNAKLLVNYVHDSVIRAAKLMKLENDNDAWMRVQREFSVSGMLRKNDEKKAKMLFEQSIEQQQLESGVERAPSPSPSQQVANAWEVFTRLGHTAANHENQKLSPEIRRRVFASDVPSTDIDIIKAWTAAKNWTPQKIREIIGESEQEEMTNAILGLCVQCLENEYIMDSNYRENVKRHMERLLASKGRGTGKQVSPPESLSEALEMAEEQIEEAGDVEGAPDDPEGQVESIQDFGVGTSQQDSESPLSGVPPVATDTKKLPVIGFQPAGSSSD